MELPERDEAAEDAFVAWASALEEAEPLVEAIEAAMAARRPKLAARLVGFVEDFVEIEPGTPLDRAHAAARLLLVTKGDPHELFLDLENAWRDAHSRRVWRMRRRMRERARGSNERVSRWDSRRRRR